MGLSRIQLLSRGAQDVHLTGTPRVSLFRTVYHRHTNFALETVEQIFDQQPTWGSTSSATLTRQGDLVQSMFLRVTAPQLYVPPSSPQPVFLRYCNSFCHALVRSCQLKIGGQTVNTVPGSWMEVQDELTNSEVKRKGYGHAIGKQYLANGKPDDYHLSDEQVSYENHMGSKRAVTFFLPVRFYMRSAELSIPIVSLKHQEVTVHFEFRDILELVNWRWAESSSMNSGDVPAFVRDDVTIEMFATFVYLDTDEQRFVAEKRHEFLIEQIQHAGYLTTNQASSFRLPFRHPVKELVWTVSRPGRNVHFDYGEHEGVERVVSAQLRMNGRNVLPSLHPKFYRTLMPYKRHTRVPSRHIYSHCFSLEPEATYPTGSLNFSRFAVVTLDLTLAEGTEIDVYAVSYNVLRIMNGTASVGFA